MCHLHQLKDGTYNIYDLEVMHQIIEIKSHASASKPVDTHAPTLSGVFGA